QKGSDLSDRIRLYPGADVSNQTTTRARRDIKTVLLPASNTAFGEPVEADEDYITRWGRRERFVKFDDAVDADTATNMATPLLDVRKDEIQERRVSVDYNRPGRRPFVDFNLGDYLGVVFGNEVHTFRVIAIAFQHSKDGVRTEVVLNNSLESARRMADFVSVSVE